jgi:hypothetical protein
MFATHSIFWCRYLGIKGFQMGISWVLRVSAVSQPILKNGLLYLDRQLPSKN